MSHCVGNMMNQAIFSVRYGRRDPTWAYLQRTAKLGTLAPVNFLPFLRFLPSVRRNIQTIKETQRVQFAQYEQLTRAREQHLAQGNSPECFTDFYLQEMEKRKGQPGCLSRRQMYFFQGDMYGAGTETS